MDYNTAIIILGLPNKFDEKLLKKRYHLMALKYHPDKNNNSNDAKEKFVEVQNAYEFLNNSNIKNLRNEDYTKKESDNEYNNIFSIFFQSLFDGNRHSELIMKLIHNLAFNYEDFVMNSLGKDIFYKLDNDTTIYLYETLCKYQKIIGLSDEALLFVKKIVNERIKEDMIIVLNPSLDDLLNDNIYVLNYENKKFFIPLWHDELHYTINNANDNNTKTLIVVCKPELPSNIELNDDGDLVVVVRENIKNVFINKGITYNISNREFFIKSDELKITKYQHYVINNKGVSLINTNDLYDNTMRGNIHFIIELY
jgi:hypothetical protein